MGRLRSGNAVVLCNDSFRRYAVPRLGVDCSATAHQQALIPICAIKVSWGFLDRSQDEEREETQICCAARTTIQ
jgi:hypothetical protein